MSLLSPAPLVPCCSWLSPDTACLGGPAVTVPFRFHLSPATWITTRSGSRRSLPPAASGSSCTPSRWGAGGIPAESEQLPHCCIPTAPTPSSCDGSSPRMCPKTGCRLAGWAGDPPDKCWVPPGCVLGCCAWSLYLSPGSACLPLGRKQSPAESDGLAAGCETLQRKPVGFGGEAASSQLTAVERNPSSLSLQKRRGGKSLDRDRPRQTLPLFTGSPGYGISI